jgi:hypothetical protein
MQPKGKPSAPGRPMVLTADPERIAHSLRVLDLLEQIDADRRAKAPSQLPTPIGDGRAEPLAS